MNSEECVGKLSFGREKRRVSDDGKEWRERGRCCVLNEGWQKKEKRFRVQNCGPKGAQNDLPLHVRVAEKFWGPVSAWAARRFYRMGLLSSLRHSISVENAWECAVEKRIDYTKMPGARKKVYFRLKWLARKTSLSTTNEQKLEPLSASVPYFINWATTSLNASWNQCKLCQRLHFEPFLKSSHTIVRRWETF